MRDPFEIGGVSIPPGTRRTVDMPVSVMADHTPVTLSAHVIHGRKPGPVMFVSAAIHGDEVIGVEIVRRLLNATLLDRLAGTLVAVPIVNSFGFLNRARYLPDRRDLNRSFPGYSEGSLAGRLAHLFTTEVLAQADVGIDLHSAAQGRENLPQIRLTPGDARLQELARAFAAPVTLISKTREGSLREVADSQGVDLLLFEAAEGLRFDEFAARAGVAGILRVMAHLGMLTGRGVPKARKPAIFCEGSAWLRAPMGGLIRTLRGSGDLVEAGEVLGVIANPFGDAEVEVQAENAGIVIGRVTLPVVNEGDALFHIAEPREEAAAEDIAAHLSTPALFDEDEII